MALSSSSRQVRMVVESGKSLHIKLINMDVIKEDLKIIVDQIVDFESSSMNGYPI